MTIISKKSLHVKVCSRSLRLLPVEGPEELELEIPEDDPEEPVVLEEELEELELTILELLEELSDEEDVPLPLGLIPFLLLLLLLLF